MRQKNIYRGKGKRDTNEKSVRGREDYDNGHQFNLSYELEKYI